MKKLKIFLLTILLIPSILLFSACSLQSDGIGRTIESIEKYSTSGLVDTYVITYTDDTVSYFTVTNGLNGTDGTDGADGTNGESVSIADIYVEAQNSGYEGTFLEFLEVYLTFENVGNDTTVATNKALLSSVSIYSSFTNISNYEYMSAGSGVIYSLNKETGDAYIITNYHVVYDNDSATVNKISDDIAVYFYALEYEQYGAAATYIGGSMTYDIAVLKITNNEILKTSGYEAIISANSDEIIVGETAIAIGNPEAEGISATEGIVSVDSEYITMIAVDEITEITFRVMRIDTAVNSGNSGGGLFNKNGELIGIVNAKIMDDSIENIAYAIPSNIALGVTQNIIDNFEINASSGLQKMLFGLLMTSTNTKAVYNETTLSVNIIEDVIVDEITVGSVSESLGFQVGDIVNSIQINDTTYDINRMFTLIDSVLNIRAGDNIIFVIERNNETMQITYTILETDLVEIA